MKAGEVREITSLEDMRSFASEVSDGAGRRLLLLLVGPMGAGKTQFTRFLVEALGSQETCSPSFAIHHRYDSPRGVIEHMDLYRLESEDDLESIGFWDFFSAPEGIVIIEWADRLEEFGLKGSLPRSWPRLEFKFELVTSAAESRRVTVVESV